MASSFTSCDVEATFTTCDCTSPVTLGSTRSCQSKCIPKHRRVADVFPYAPLPNHYCCWLSCISRSCMGPNWSHSLPGNVGRSEIIYACEAHFLRVESSRKLYRNFCSTCQKTLCGRRRTIGASTIQLEMLEWSMRRMPPHTCCKSVVKATQRISNVTGSSLYAYQNRFAGFQRPLRTVRDVTPFPDTPKPKFLLAIDIPSALWRYTDGVYLSKSLSTRLTGDLGA